MATLVRSRLAASLRYPREAWILAGVILLVTLSTGSTVTPILPDMRLYFGLTGTGTALIVSFFSMARLSVDLPAGLLLDRFNHKVLLLAGALLVGLGSVLSAVAAVLPILLLGQLAAGIGVNTCMIAAMVTFSRMSTAGTRGGMFGLYTAGTLLSSSIGPVASGMLATALDWRATFVFSAAAATTAFLLTWFGVESHPLARRQIPPLPPRAEPLSGQAAQHGDDEAAAGWTWALPIYLIVFLLYLGSSGITHSALPLYANETLHLTASAIGWAMGLAMLFRSVISIAGGKLGDRYGHRLIVTVGLTIIGIGFLSLTRAAGFGGLLAALLLISLGHIGTALPDAWLVSLIPGRRWGASLGISRFWADLAHVIGPVGILYIFDHWGFSLTTVIGACLMWLAAIVAMAIVRRT
jgi:MFS family permease